MSRTAHAALDKHLSEMPNLPPVAWENVKFDENMQGGVYLTVHFIPASVERATLGDRGSFYESGIYQVTISAPSGQGSGEVQALADRICDHFRCKTIGAVRTRLPRAAQAMPEAGRIRLPISISYFTETFF